MLFTKPTAAETRAPAVHLADYPLFDWLRFALAAIVVFVHANLLSSEAGALAVYTFFALSGWLIGGILLRSERRDLPRFFFNRATRIWVPFAVAIALLYGLSATLEPVTPRWLEFLFYDVTFTRNWFGALPTEAEAFGAMPFHGLGGHFWSICVEEQFYLIAPLAIVLLPKYGRSLWLWTVLSLALMAARSNYAPVTLGVLAAIAQTRYPNWHLARGATLGLAILLAVSVFALAFVSFKIYAPIFSISAVLLLARPGMRSTVGEFVGGISFPVYLNHWIGSFAAHSMVKRAGLPVFTEAWITVLLGIAAGAICYVLVDRPILKYRGPLFTIGRGISMAGAAYSLVAAGLLFGVARWVILTP